MPPKVLMEYGLKIIHLRKRLRNQAIEVARGSDETFPELQAKTERFIEKYNRGYFQEEKRSIQEEE